MTTLQRYVRAIDAAQVEIPHPGNHINLIASEVTATGHAKKLKFTTPEGDSIVLAPGLSADIDKFSGLFVDTADDSGDDVGAGTFIVYVGDGRITDNRTVISAESAIPVSGTVNIGTVPDSGILTQSRPFDINARFKKTLVAEVTQSIVGGGLQRKGVLFQPQGGDVWISNSGGVATSGANVGLRITDGEKFYIDGQTTWYVKSTVNCDLVYLEYRFT